MSQSEATEPKTYDDGRPMVKCCVHLRCKSLGYTSGTERPGLLHESDVMHFWCNITQEVIGCDGSLAGLKECTAHDRGCCEM